LPEATLQQRFACGTIARTGIGVIYIFEKEKEGSLRLETRYARSSKSYEIIWRRADGTTTKETFNGETSFRARLQEIQIELEDEEWRTVGPPHLLADGWKI
jgi:hypothetical protein